MEIELGVKGIENVSTDLSMMDPMKYYFYSTASSFGIRALVYPVTLVRTQLQNQDSKPLLNTAYQIQKEAAKSSDRKPSLSKVQFQTPKFQGYNGMYDAFKKILKQRGPRGFYDGFFVNSFGVVQSVIYIWTYENTKQYVEQKLNKLGPFSSSNVKLCYAPFFGVASASLLSLIFSLPIDIVSQFLQDAKSEGSKGTSIQLLHKVRKLGPKQNVTLFVIKELWKLDGIYSFYKGFGVAYLLFMVNGAVFWLSYYGLCKVFFDSINDRGVLIDHGVYTVSGTIAGLFGCIVTNPIELTRNQTQMHQTKARSTFERLLTEEGLKRMYFKGLPPRLVSSAVVCGLGLPLYEYIKKICIKDEYLSL